MKLFDVVEPVAGTTFRVLFDGEGPDMSPCPTVMSDDGSNAASDVLRFVNYETIPLRAYYADCAVMDYGNHLLEVAGHPLRIERVEAIDRDGTGYCNMNSNEDMRRLCEILQTDLGGFRYRLVST